MPASARDLDTTSAKGAWFKTTHWTLVLDAGQQDSAQAQTALAQLCQTYWYPLYVFIRRQGHRPEDAQDLVQGFFARLLEKNYFKVADRDKGKFRSFLLIALKRYMANEWERSQRHKRGGGLEIISLNDTSAEASYLIEPVDELSPDQVFDRRWAEAILQKALDRLRREYAAAGKEALFDCLKDLQPGQHGTLSFAELGAQLGMSETALRSAVHRLRKRHRAILREEIAHTVSGPEQIDDEIRYLLALLGK